MSIATKIASNLFAKLVSDLENATQHAVHGETVTFLDPMHAAVRAAVRARARQRRFSCAAPRDSNWRSRARIATCALACTSPASRTCTLSSTSCATGPRRCAAQRNSQPRPLAVTHVSGVCGWVQEEGGLVTEEAMRELESVTELDYLSHMVMRLHAKRVSVHTASVGGYKRLTHARPQSRTGDSTPLERYRVEIFFSPGTPLVRSLSAVPVLPLSLTARCLRAGRSFPGGGGSRDAGGVEGTEAVRQAVLGERDAAAEPGAASRQRFVAPP